MKKNQRIFLLLIILAAAAAWLYYKKSAPTIKGELRDFAVKDTASIDKLFLADRDGNTVTLVRQAVDRWMVNNKFIARQDAVDNLLYTISAVEVRSPVGKNLYNNTMKLMAAKAVKIEIYSGEKILKTYYVGHPTMDNLGTFMYLESSSVPFITHIPGFNGFLSTRYFTKEAEWRNKFIFRLNPRRITEVEVMDLARPYRSFLLQRQSDSSYVVKKTTDNQFINPVDVTKIRSFLLAFEDTYFERIENRAEKSLVDSILQTGPFASIMVKMDDGGGKQLICYRMPPNPEGSLQIKFDGKPQPFDLDRFYGKMSGDSALLVCQYMHFDRIFKDPANFRPGADASPKEQRLK
jgi:hypothetical protein